MALLVLSCGARKARKFRSDETKKEKTDSTFTNVKSVDSLKDVFTKINTTTINDVVSWHYEAPNDTIRSVNPVWIRAGKDSINLSSLPKGSKLYFSNVKSIMTKDSTNIDKTETKVKDSIGVKLNKETENSKSTKTSDVQRESTNWVLAFIAFLLGWFLIPIIKSIFKK